MLKQIIVTLDTSDPLQAQLLVEYLASTDRVRFGRCCMLLGYLAATKEDTQENEVKPIPVVANDTAPKIIPSIALTLEDLGIDEEESITPPELNPVSSQSLSTSEPTLTVGSTPAFASPNPTLNSPKDEMKTAAKPKVGGGLFGLG